MAPDDKTLQDMMIRRLIHVMRNRIASAAKEALAENPDATVAQLQERVRAVLPSLLSADVSADEKDPSVLTVKLRLDGVTPVRSQR